ncbi:MAG: hypothetical protein EAZ76_02245 [Nostocales cyanobacterium]|nr:MAG: hypothetical protein EAZ87_10665 [Nostocales cyanobacterium]TAF20156.1 MAG: hypothetical protein EAZ76_02245 [Nostocales cyanobacterium]
MANASIAPVLANSVIEQKTTEKQEIQENSAEEIVLIPATKDTPSAVQIVPVKDYIALKGEASLEGKQILEVIPESSARNKNNKDFDKNNKSSLTPEADYFVVLPEGQELSATELEQVEGEVAWFVPGLVGAGVELAFQAWDCRTRSCTWEDYARAGVKGAVSAYLIPGGTAARSGVRFFQNGQRINGLRVFVR